MIEHARALQKEAQTLLESKQIPSFVKEIGELFYTGSYALNLMTWRDIDMQIVCKEAINPVEALSSLFVYLSKDPDFIEAKLVRFKDDYKLKMPRGVYLNAKLNAKELGGVWKIDFWCLEKEEFLKNRALLEKLQEKLTPEKRALILEIKHALMQESGRVPQLGSHNLYQAVLLEGLTDKEHIYKYLEKRGVKIPE